MDKDNQSEQSGPKKLICEQYNKLLVFVSMCGAFNVIASLLAAFLLAAVVAVNVWD